MDRDVAARGGHLPLPVTTSPPRLGGVVTGPYSTRPDVRRARRGPSRENPTPLEMVFFRPRRAGARGSNAVKASLPALTAGNEAFTA